MDFSWSTHNDTCANNHFPMILEGLNTNPKDKIPNWNLKKENLNKFTTICSTELTPNSNTKNQDQITYFTITITFIAEKCIPEFSKCTKHNYSWFNEECRKAIKLCKAVLRKFNVHPTAETKILSKYAEPKV